MNENITTIVSGFVDLTKHDETYSNKNLNIYLEKAKKLLEIKIPKIIFIENHLLENLPKDEMTHYIPFDIKELWFYPHYERIKNLPNPRVANPKKDTNLYISVTIQKTEWMKKAAMINHFNTEQFMWIDFGIFHISNDDIDFKNRIINKTRYKIQKDVIHLPSACKYQENFDDFQNYTRKMYQEGNLNKSIFKYAFWFFAGGMFMCNKNSIIKFSSLVKKKALELVENDLLTWEVNIWYMIYLENKDLFSVYTADHNVSMFY
jgi:hypothetical protein